MVAKGLVGDLRSMPLPEVFQWVAFSNKTGELHLQKENDEVNIMFLNGKIAYVTTNLPHLLLGQLLLRYKMLNKNDLVKSLSLQKQLKIPIGQVLIENGLLDEKSVKRILEIQVEEVVYTIVNWDNGFFIFEEKEIRPTMINISVDMLILEGLRRKDDMGRFFKVYSNKSILALKNSDYPIKDVVDGKRTVYEIVTTLGGDYFKTYELIYTGIINGDLYIVEEGDYIEENDPIVKFIIGLELFNKNKIYESFKTIQSIINSGFKNEHVKKFYDNMVLHITRYFYKKFGGESTVFTINRLKLIDEKIYITPVEGFVLSRIEEYPTVSKLLKVLNLDKIEVFLIIDKLYKLGLLLIKQNEKNKTEIMENNVINTLLNIYGRELSGELELVSSSMTVKLFFENGRLKFLYSTTPEFSFIKYLQDRESFVIDSGDMDDFNLFIMKFLEKNNYSLEDFKPIAEIYITMIFYELLQSEIISTIFIYDKRFPLNFDFKFNILFMIMLAIVNNKVKPKITINKSINYELVKNRDIIIEDFGNIGLIRNLMDYFQGNILSRDQIAEFNDYELMALELLFKLGCIKENEVNEISVEELNRFLTEIKSKTAHEIFGVSENYDVESVKQKFLKFSKLYHPDLITNPEGKQIAREIFELIKYAYDSLLQKVEDGTGKKRIDVRNILLAEQLLTSGKVYLNMGRINDAIDSFIKAYNAFSHDDEITVYYGYALIKKGEYDKGVKLMDMVGIEKFDDPELYAAMIEAYINLKKKVDAKKYLDKAILKFPDKVRRFNIYSSKVI